MRCSPDAEGRDCWWRELGVTVKVVRRRARRGLVPPLAMSDLMFVATGGDVVVRHLAGFQRALRIGDVRPTKEYGKGRGVAAEAADAARPRQAP